MWLLPPCQFGRHVGLDDRLNPVSDLGLVEFHGGDSGMVQVATHIADLVRHDLQRKHSPADEGGHYVVRG
jgi:hypothetical protein